MTTVSPWSVEKLYSFNVSHLILTPDLLIRAQRELTVLAFLGLAGQCTDQIHENLCENSEFKWKSSVNR